MASVEKRRQHADLEGLTEPELSAVDRRELLQGIQLFNDERFWDSHESWEQVWRRHKNTNRIFFQGLIQVAAGMHQVRRGIYHGADKHLRNALWKLRPFEPVCADIDVSDLVSAVAAVHKEVQRLGSDGLKSHTNLLSPKIKLWRRSAREGRRER